MLDRMEELGVDVDGLGLRASLEVQLTLATAIVVFGRAPSSRA